MSTKRDTTRLVESWLAEPGPPLDDHVIHAAIDRVPGLRQRRRWWPFKWFPLGFGATRSSSPARPLPDRRSHHMFNATRVAIGVAVLALGGSLALLLGPLGSQSDQVPPPAATSPSPAPRADGAITGAVRLGVLTYGEEVAAEDWTETRGNSWRATWTSDDPRLAGDGTFVLNINTYQAEDGSEVSAGWSEVTIENEGGSWTSLVPTSGVGIGDSGRSAFWLDGADGYEGLSAFTVQTLAWNQVGAPYYEFEAWIVPGDAHLTQMFE